jgi:hypothetical protein
MTEPAIRISDLLPVLQVAIGPVILISGVGLLLLTLSNRFGRAVDRARLLVRETPQAPPAKREQLSAQVGILYRRARLIRLSITLVVVSVLLASVLIVVLFFTALFRFEAGILIVTLFIACLLSLIGALSAFIREIHLSLKALKLELFGQEQSGRDSNGGEAGD